MSDQEPDHREVMAERDAATQDAAKKSVNRGCLIGVVAFFVLFGLCYAAGSSDDDGGSGEATNARALVEARGDDWPLTVADGTIRCENGGQVTFEGGGTKYAVNGTARGQTDLPDIDPIWADSTDGLGKKNIGPIISVGLTLCD